jgi:hypothetical protein
MVGATSSRPESGSADIPAGTYYLKVKSKDGSTGSYCLDISVTPENTNIEAVISTPDPTWLRINEQTCFDGSDSYGVGGISDWLWSFGDGNSTWGYNQPWNCWQESQVRYTYGDVDVYRSTLQVWDNYGHTDSNSMTNYVVDYDMTVDSTYLCRDLVPIHLYVRTPKPDDKVQLGPTGAYWWAIKVWEDAGKTRPVLPYGPLIGREWPASEFATPKTWYVEGVPGDFAQYPSLVFSYLGIHPDYPYGRSVGQSNIDFTVGKICDCWSSFENETDWIPYPDPENKIPDHCYHNLCDGEDATFYDDCRNELEVSCAQADGTGGDTGCAYRYFYNNNLISSCTWYNGVNHWWYKVADTGGLMVFTKAKHITADPDNYDGEGCYGYYDSIITFYNCLTGTTDRYLVRNRDHMPMDLNDGEIHESCQGPGP